MQTEARKPPTENNGLWTAWLARFQAGAAAVTPLAATPAFAQNAPPSVTVATPVTRDVAEWQEHTARIEPSARVEIRPRVSGQIDQVHFEDGAIVRQGDLLFTIDQRPFRSAVDQAQAGLARAEAQLTLAAQQVERYTPLAQSRIAPQAELETR